MAKKSVLKSKKIRQKSLTLNDLVKYNREVLFPVLDNKLAKIDEKFKNIDNEIKEKFNKVLIGQDKIMKTLEDIKSDNTASLGAQKRQEDKLEDHEIRIKIVERKAGIVAIR